MESDTDKKNVGRKKLTGLGRRMAQIRTQAVNAVYMRPPHRMNLKHKNRKKVGKILVATQLASLNPDFRGPIVVML